LLLLAKAEMVALRKAAPSMQMLWLQLARENPLSRVLRKNLFCFLSTCCAHGAL